jgi:hypothetical protein
MRVKGADDTNASAEEAEDAARPCAVADARCHVDGVDLRSRSELRAERGSARVVRVDQEAAHELLRDDAHRCRLDVGASKMRGECGPAQLSLPFLAAPLSLWSPQVF